MCVFDTRVGHPERIQSSDPPVEIGWGASKGDVIQADRPLVEGLRGRWVGVRVQTEEHPVVEGEHGVVEGPRLLVLVEHRVGVEEGRIPSGARGQVGHGDRHVGEAGKCGHRRLRSSN